MADFDPAFMQQIFHVPQRQQEPDLHHHRKADDFGERLEVAKGAALGHPERLCCRHAPLKQVRLTEPHSQK